MVKVTSSNIILSTTLPLTQNKKLGITGSIGIWVGSSPPDGALLCDGSLKLVSLYPNLAASLGASGLTFNVPNLSGELPLGTNSNVRVESGNLKIQAIGHTHLADTSRFASVFDDTNIEVGDSDPQKYIEQFSGQQVSTITSSFNTLATQIDYLPPYFAVNFIIYT